MPKGTSVPITPSVLEWAIKESGYSLAAVAEKIKVPSETLLTWVRGNAEPKLTEFRRLATLLKRTPATFLLLALKYLDIALNVVSGVGRSFRFAVDVNQRWV